MTVASRSNFHGHFPCIIGAAFLFAGSIRPVCGGVGEVEAAFGPVVDGRIYATAMAANGKILVGGDFRVSGSQQHTYLMRLHPDGSVEHDFAPVLNQPVRSIAVLPDEKILITGAFATVNGVDRRGMARLQPDGTVDETFQTSMNGYGGALALQWDGSIIIAGSLTAAGEQTARRVVRLNASGTMDPSFSPVVNGTVYSVAVQADGKTLIGGEFTSVNGAVHRRIARLHPNGSVDAGFTPDVSHGVTAVTLQGDGKILIGGWFGGVNGTGRQGLARLNTDGTLDGGFGAEGNFMFPQILVQADGKVLLAGTFSTINEVRRLGLARLLPSGAVDAGFVSPAQFQDTCATLQPDGRIVIGGMIYQPLVWPDRDLVRVGNDVATQNLLVSGVSRVQWLRGGTSPETQGVVFEMSGDGGNTWTTPNRGSRIAGGWELNGLNRPVSGEIRARAFTPGGQYQGSSSLMEAVTTFGGAAPEIAVEIQGGVSLSSGNSIVDLETVMVSSAGEVKTFTIKNTGTASLNVGMITASGGEAADFVIRSAGTLSRVPAGRETTFTVTLAPSSPPGRRSTTLQIASGDADENPFSITLTGIAVPSNNARLVSCFTPAGPLSPDFESGTTAYSLSVPYPTTSMTVRPVVAQANATVRVNGKSVLPGATSSPVYLGVGGNTIQIVVTAQDGVTTRTYTLIVARAPFVEPGDLDEGFNPDADSNVESIAVQPDGKILIGGSFSKVGGVSRARIARLHSDGRLEPEFSPGVDGSVDSWAVQADGKILIAGYFFPGVGGLPQHRFVRLNGDGTLDVDFAPDSDGPVDSVAVQNDGKIIIAGEFTAVAGVARIYLARLNPGGGLDAAFDPNVSNYVYGAALQEDGQLIIWGLFTSVGGVPRSHIARLRADGTLDGGFAPEVDCCVSRAVLQSDGKILIEGSFSNVGGVPRTGFARLHPGGGLDDSFDASLQTTAQSVVVQTDGRVIVGGSVSEVNGVPREGIGRLLSDGALDQGFDPRVNDAAYAVAQQANGRIIIGGLLRDVDGMTRHGIARLENGAAPQSLTIPDAGRVRWMRGGTSPETQQVTFDLSTDGGTTWTRLGTGTRIEGGWELTGLNLPDGGFVRARARVTGGIGNRSSGLVETVVSLQPTPLEAWRQLHFATMGNSGDAGDASDPDRDGLANLIEFAFGKNPMLATSRQLPEAHTSGGNLTLTFLQPDGVTGISYAAEWAETLDAVSWSTLQDTGISPQHTFIAPTAGREKLFLRLRVTVP